ncbi:MAG: adenosylmethionine--8-amino-7-oxononanoate transaminase [Candidatus Omnitrophota bacterium]
MLKAKAQNDKLPFLDKKYVWHPFTQMQDWLKQDNLIIDEAKGNYLKDIKGNWYLDGVSSLWINVHGHRHREINRAIVEQLNKLEHSTLLGLSNTPSIGLAKMLIEIAPSSLKKVFYSDSGSTAVEIALKIAYQYWQNRGLKNKQKIIHFSNSYHGDTLGAVSVGGMDLFHKIYRPLLFSSLEVSAPIHITDLAKLKKIIEREHNSVAALITESGIEAAAGMIVWEKGILKEIENLCKKYKITFIIDEVATGFGRTGKMFACEHESVKPDIMCVAKGLTAGYLPLAATLTTDDIYNAFLADYKDQKTFFHGHTYTGNPLACAAAIASLKIFKKENTLLKLQPKTALLKKRLEEFYKLEHVKDVRQFGFMVGIELAPYKWQDKIGVKVCEKIKEKNIILRPLGNVIVLMPPLSITKQELNYLLDSTYWAIETITEK